MTFIIAEVGSNFHTINDCIQSIGFAAISGADAVKFQMATQEELYGYDAGLDIDHHFVKPEWLPILKEKADSCNIEFMCTAFSVQGYAQVNKYVTKHKVASCENCHSDILRTLNHYDKHVIVSLGSTHLEEALWIKEMLSKVPRLTFMYCEASYPANETKLENIQLIREKIHGLVGSTGFSDHSTDFCTIPVDAVHHYGADIIEKHFNPLSLRGTPDAPHSINRYQFKLMVDRIRGDLSPSDMTFDTSLVLKHRRRIKCISPIKEGEKFSTKNIGIFRSIDDDMQALSPIIYDRILGHKSSHDFTLGEGIHL